MKTGSTDPLLMPRAGAGTEHVAIRMSPDGKGIFMLPASAVRAGATDAGDPIPITSASKTYIVASRARKTKMRQVKARIADL